MTPGSANRDLSRSIVIGTAWAVFALCCMLPVVWMFATSGGHSRGPELGDARQRALFLNTLTLGAGAVMLSLAVGVPFGILLARCEQRLAALPRALLIVPLVLPSYVLALTWMVLFRASRPEWVYRAPSAIAILGLSLYPMVMLATEASLRSIPTRLQEAAWIVASPRRTWARIILPLMAPAVSASALLVFVLAISDFAVPGLLRVRVYTTEVFTAFAALYDFRLAAMIALPLVAVATLASTAALIFAHRPIVGRSERGPAGKTWSLARQRGMAAVLVVTALLLLGVPLRALIGEALSGRASLGESLSGDAIRNSFTWSAAGASLVLVVGTLLAYWRTHTRPRLGRAADILFAAMFAVPSAVLAIGVIALWNRAGLAGDIYRSDAIVLIAYLGRFLPLAALVCSAFLRSVPAAAEEAALVAGASWTRACLRVVLPMARNGLLAAWFILFILIFGDIGVTILVAPPGEATVPVRAYTLIANSPSPDVARIGLLQIALSVLPLGVIVMLLRPGVERSS